MRRVTLLSLCSLCLSPALARAQATDDPTKIAPTAHASPSGPAPSEFGGALPPGHPALEQAGDGQLPPGHPALDGAGDRAGDRAGALPPGHPPVSDAADPSSVSGKELLAKLDSMKEELKNRPKTAEIEFALGNLYYENGRYPEAIDFYRQLGERARGPMERWLAVRKTAHGRLTPEQAGCPASARPSFEQLVAIADAKAAAHDDASADVCYEAALGPVIAAEVRRANAFFLIGNADKALELHEKVLAIEPDLPESQFFLGAILYETGDGDLGRLTRAKAAWEKFLKEEPDPDRKKLVMDNLSKIEVALRNGGRLPDEQAARPRFGPAFGPIGAPAQAPTLSAKDRRALEEALREGEARSAKRDWAKALNAFERARKLDPDDDGAARGAGIALLNLGRREEAEAALRAALGRDPADGIALYELGEVFFENEHYAGAARFWSQLLQSDPKVAQQYGVQQRLADAKSRQQ